MVTVNFLYYPLHKPDESGYYYTCYRQGCGEYFYKAIWYQADKDKWVAWNRNYDPVVIGFIRETRADFYTLCVDNFERHQKDKL